MGLRTSVTGWIAIIVAGSTASGCAGQLPGQARAMDLRGLAPLAKLATTGDQKAMAALAAVAATTDPKALGDAKAAALAAVKAGEPAADGRAEAKATPEAPPKAEAAAEVKAPVAPVEAAKAAEPVPPADAAKAPEAPAPEVAPAIDPALAAKAEPEAAAPEIGFMIPGLGDLAAALAPAEDPKVLFRETFDDGLAAWVSRGLGLPAQAAKTGDEDGVVLATSRARRSLWIKTRTEIDLADAAQPRLRLAFKGQPAALKAVWETEHGAFPEEIMLAPVEAEADDAPVEYDLTALKQRPGHLVLVARAPKGGAAAPVLDGVTIFDAAGPKLAATAI